MISAEVLLSDAGQRGDAIVTIWGLIRARHCTIAGGMIRYLSLLCLLFVVSSLHAKEFKVIAWNVLYGFNHGKEMEAGATWLMKQKPDVVALQELNGFDEKKLAKLAKTWGHSHSEILKTDGFPVGLTSKTPIQVVERIRDGLWHGCLHARTANTDFLVIHLCPGVRSTREEEMKLLTPRVAELLRQNRSLFVLGDFNDKSPVDLIYTNAQKILIEKAVPENLLDGRFDGGVVGGFLDAGLVDSAAPLPGNFSVPTRMKSHANTAVKQARFMQRIDFILTDPKTAEALRTTYISRDSVLDAVSDHYPVIHSSDRW